jgi:N-methylhydantoinase A
VARAPSATPALAAAPPAEDVSPTERRVFAGGEFKTAAVYREPPGELDGLAIVELPDTTIVIGEGQHATVDDHGNVVIEVKR